MSRVLPAINGASFTTAALRTLRERARPALARSNFRQRTVSLAGGIAAATGALAGSVGTPGPEGRAAALAIGPAGALGAYDDLSETPQASSTKGLKGHLGALRTGEITTGMAKLAGISLAGLAAGGVLASARDTRGWAKVADAVTSGALIAGTANLLNLFDLRPGRALKVAIIGAAPIALAGGSGSGVASAVVTTSAASLPSDLAETTMLGDTGANALGAGLGVALAAQPSPLVRAGALAGVLAATLASEKVSFSRVIEKTPVLREIDTFGRLPA